MMHYWFVDADFIPVYDIPTVAGRTFTKDGLSDMANACVINASAVKKFGFTTAEEAVGKQIVSGWGGKHKEIIGVVEDFHFRSVHYAVEPLIMEQEPAVYGNITLSLTSARIEDALAAIRQTWSRLFPDRPFEYYYLDTSLNRLYRGEERIGRLFMVLTMMGILVACLGLFGLASFTAEQRTKEIGVRKILGATVPAVVISLTKEFAKWVLMGTAIAWPLATWAVQAWLKNFAYHVEVGPGPFVLSTAMAFILVCLTVSYQSVRAALRNPVDALRYE